MFSSSAPSRRRSPSPDNYNGLDDAANATNATSSGLHHRRLAVPASSNSLQQSRQAVDPRYRERAHRRRRQRRATAPYGANAGSSWTTWIRYGLMAGIPAYLVVLVVLQRTYFGARGGNSRTLAQLAVQAQHARDQRWSKDKLAHQQRMLQSQSSSSAERRQRLVDQVPGAVNEDFIFPYEIWLADRQPRKIPAAVKTAVEPPNTIVHMEDLCGYVAQTAFGQHPDRFQPLAYDASVLITGSVSTALGYATSLALQQRCGVEQITTADALFPNTLEHRLSLQDRMKTLTQTTAATSRPVIPYVGLDPLKLPKKNMPTLATTGELDYVQAYQPTHIVHLAESAPLASTVSPLYAIRTALTGMEQLLASLATNQSPQEPPVSFVYASSNRHLTANKKHQILHDKLSLMKEILADSYQARYGISSIAIRLPNAVYGPYSTEPLETLLASNSTDLDQDEEAAAESLDWLHVDEVVDALLAVMQYRTSSGTNEPPLPLELTSGGTAAGPSVRSVLQTMHQVMAQKQEKSAPEALPQAPAVNEYWHNAEDDTTTSHKTLRKILAWNPRLSLTEGLARTLAWQQNQKFPFGFGVDGTPNVTQQALPPMEGDELLEHYQLSTCAPDNRVCSAGTPVLPCASGCSPHKQCTTSILDPIVTVLQEVTAGCDVVLYTQELGRDITDLRLHSEYMVEGEPLICNIALVSVESPLVQQVIQKVPDSELEKLGVKPSPQDQGNPGAFHKRKVANLNGRLLFRGWILVWPLETPETVSVTETALIKLTPGVFLSSDVSYALYIDQTFTVSPSIADIHFLVSEMKRDPLPARLVKRKTRPKAKFVLPPEPARRAVLLVSELKYQASSDAERLPSDTKVSVYEATRFMRFERGEEPLGKETPAVKAHREFYERMPSILNRDLLRSSAEPAHKWEISNWARTRWVLHDLQLEEARELRCDWYREEVGWQSGLDQLSLAAVMARRDLYRKLHHNEPDETIQKALSEKTGMKKLLSDAFEWDALETEENKLYSPYEEMKILPYEIEYEVEEPEEVGNGPTHLFVRVMSDRIMSLARKVYNDKKELEEIEKKIREKEAAEKAEADSNAAVKRDAVPPTEKDANSSNPPARNIHQVATPPTEDKTGSKADGVPSSVSQTAESDPNLDTGGEEEHNNPPIEDEENHNVPPENFDSEEDGAKTEALDIEGAGIEVVENPDGVEEAQEGGGEEGVVEVEEQIGHIDAEIEDVEEEVEVEDVVDGVAPPDKVDWDFEKDENVDDNNVQ